MTSQQLIQTLLPAKKKKLRFILDWINNNCDQYQKEEVNKLLSEYDFLVTYPEVKMARCTHETDYIFHVPDSRNAFQNKDTSIEEEIRKRKQLINGLKTEIEELKYLR